MKQKPLTQKQKTLKQAYRSITVTLEKLEKQSPSPPSSLLPDDLIGLAALKKNEDYKKACVDYFHSLGAWVDVVKITKDAITSKSSIVSKAIGYEKVTLLTKAISMQEKSRSGAFAEDLALLKLLEAVTISLIYLEKLKSQPNALVQPSKKAWYKAIDALSALILSSRQGVPIELASIQADIPDLDAHKIKKLKTVLTGLAKNTPKPHSDSHAIYRAACKHFVQGIYISFDRTVPPSLVEKFCQIIDYNPEKVIRSYIKNWTKELDTYSK